MNAHLHTDRPQTFAHSTISGSAAFPVFNDDLEPAAPTHQWFIPKSESGKLALGTTDYGPSYFLGGMPVYDGSHLVLEMHWGWFEGLFTWTGDLNDRPKLVSFDGQPALRLETNSVLRWMTDHWA